MVSGCVAVHSTEGQVLLFRMYQDSCHPFGLGLSLISPNQELRIALINGLVAFPNYQILWLLVRFYIIRVLAARIGCLQLKIN